MHARPAVLAVAALLLAAACSNQQPTVVGSTSSAETTPPASPATSASPAPTTPPATTPPATTSSAATPTGASSPSSPAAPTPSASSTHSGSARPSTAVPELPDAIGSWTKVEQEASDGWMVGGYHNEMNIITVRARHDGEGEPKSLVTRFSNGSYVPINGVPCASGSTVRACAAAKGDVVVLLTTTDLETEELAPVVGQTLKLIS